MQWQQALELFPRMPAERAQLHTVAEACKQCSSLWCESVQGERGQRNAIKYSAAISAGEKGRQMPQLLMLFESMLGERVQRNSVTYKAAISACENGGQRQQALELLE